MGAFRRLLGIEHGVISHGERWVSAAGAFCGIFFTYWISLQFVGPESAALIVASMGASAVLLFAVPHGQLSQPWAATAGHLLSAAVGVVCARFVPEMLVAAALAVSLAVLVMHYTRCIHPPGGATALVAVIGGPDIHALGFAYVLEPIALNALTILLVALLFNYPFPWRRYPLAIAPVASPAAVVADDLEAQDIEHALKEIDSLIDATEDDLLRIYRIASLHANERKR